MNQRRSVSTIVFALMVLLTLTVFAQPAFSGMGNSEWMGPGGMGTPMFGWQQYDGFSVDTKDDLFVNPAEFSGITGGWAWIDEDGDGICDYVQNTPEFEGLGIGPFVDENGDGIHDSFQTHEFYRAMGMENFVDVDGDGLCDNYELNPWAEDGVSNMRGGGGMFQEYSSFTVDLEDDIFVNPEQFGAVGGPMMPWVDADGDGIVDYAQDSESFQNLGLGPFVDENGDGIHDPFQTHAFYSAVGMRNFVDLDGDGLCDNYTGIGIVQDSY